MKRVIFLLLILISLKLQLGCDDFNDVVEITMNTIKCNQFIISADLKEKNLHIKIISDLPSNSIINVDVCRQFWGVGSSNNFTISYYSEYAAIAKWKTGVVIKLDDKAWLDDLQNKKDGSGNVGKPIRVSEISDSVEIQVYLPLQVDNFGVKNKNLNGKEVLVANINYIQKSVAVYSPLSNSPAKSKLQINGKWIDNSEVRPVGIIYVHQERGTIHVDFLHNNGSVTKFEAMEIEVDNDARYYIKNNYDGEYFIIRNDGNLYWYDDFGLVMKCYKCQK